MSLNIQFIRDMLAQDTNAIQELKTLLSQEKEMLEQRQLSGMEELVSQKDRLLGHLSFTAKQREQLLRSANLTPDLAGWKIFLHRDEQMLRLIPAWESLTQEFIECQAANDVNGKMINRSKQTLSHLLNLIRGQVATPALYTQKGSTANYSNTHTVTKA